MTDKLIELRGIVKRFQGAGAAPRTVLDGVDFMLCDGEIVALLGQSGSGKSTLLRIAAGLATPDGGAAAYRGQAIHGPLPAVGMVFQSFALFPWLTVRQNVELGLEAQGMAPAARRARAAHMLELVRLTGFGDALPRELSGGMRQRVGIARALATHPDVLLLDEAFSALDVLTGATLREEILALWNSRRIPTRGMLVVSHDIEEAVTMADRIVILGESGRVKHALRIALPRPRDAQAPEVRALIEEVRDLMTLQPAGA